MVNVYVLELEPAVTTTVKVVTPTTSGTTMEPVLDVAPPPDIARVAVWDAALAVNAMLVFALGTRKEWLVVSGLKARQRS